MKNEQDIIDRYQQDVDGGEFYSDHSEVRVEGDEVVVTLRKKLEPWEIQGVPEPRMHGPSTKHESMLMDMVARVEMQMFSQK